MARSLTKILKRTNDLRALHEERTTIANEGLETETDKAARHRLQSARSYAQKRLRELLNLHAQLEAIASGSTQHQAYDQIHGEGSWSRNFTELSSVIDHPQWLKTPDELRQFLWGRLPNGPFKRFQQLFSRPDQYILPPYEMGERCKSVRFDLAKCRSVLGCIVDVDRVSNELLKQLHLLDDSYTGLSDVEALQVKVMLIPAVKKIFDAALPMQKGQYRLLLIEPASPEVDVRYPETPPIDPRNHGSVLYVREAPQVRCVQSLGRQLQVQHFDSVYSAQRKTLHEEQVYYAEFHTLVSITAQVQALIKDLHRDWSNLEMRDHLRSRAQQLIGEACNVLHTCQNTYKLEAHEALASAQTFRDAKERENITATLAKIVRASNQLQHRFEEADHKGGYNTQDRFVLSRYIMQGEGALTSVSENIQQSGPLLHSPSLALFHTETPLSPGQIELNVRGLLHRVFNGSVSRLDGVRGAPLQVYADIDRNLILQLQAELEQRNRTGAEHTILRLHLVQKFAKIRMLFEKMKQTVLQQEGVTIGTIRQFVTDCRSIFAQKQLMPDIVLPHAVDPFTSMLSLLEVIEARLQHYEKQDIVPSEKDQIFVRLKRFLDTIDVESSAHLVAG